MLPCSFPSVGDIPAFHCDLVMGGYCSHSCSQLQFFAVFQTFQNMSFASRYWWDNSLWECWQCIKLSRSPKLSRDDRVTGAFLRKEPTSFFRHYKLHNFRGKGEQPFDVALWVTNSEYLAEGSKAHPHLDGKCFGICNIYTKPAGPWLNKVSSKWLAH